MVSYNDSTRLSGPHRPRMEKVSGLAFLNPVFFNFLISLIWHFFYNCGCLFSFFSEVANTSTSQQWTRHAVHSTPSGYNSYMIDTSFSYDFLKTNFITLMPRKHLMTQWIKLPLPLFTLPDVMLWNSSLPNLTRKSWRRWANSFPKGNYHNNRMMVRARLLLH